MIVLLADFLAQLLGAARKYIVGRKEDNTKKLVVNWNNTASQVKNEMNDAFIKGIRICFNKPNSSIVEFTFREI